MRAAALLAALSACDSASPAPNATPFVSGRVNGGAFTQPLVATVDVGRGELRLATPPGDVSLEMVLPVPQGTGTIFFGCGAVPGATIAVVPGGALVSVAPAVTDCYAIGQVTITALDAATGRIAGRFAFNARIGEEAKPSVKVTDGLFAGAWLAVAPLARVSPSR